MPYLYDPDMATRYQNLVYDSARWDGFVFRDDDIVICTPAKCGTTWTQMICALLVFGPPPFPMSLDLISPWVDMLMRDRDSVISDLDAQNHRRFIKTHTPLDGLPWDDRVTYLCVGRDPRDVGMSWDNHMANMDMDVFMNARASVAGLDDVADLLAAGPPPMPESPLDRFWMWTEYPLDAPAASLASTLAHLETFWAVRDRPNVIMIRYEDLKNDLEGSMRMLATRLGIDVREESWPTLVEAATFESMRSRATELAPNSTSKLWHDNDQFFHRGTSGQWRTLLDEEGNARYKARAATLASPELLQWLHQPT